MGNQIIGTPMTRPSTKETYIMDSSVEYLKDSIREWGEHPDAYFANVHVEVIGWKPG
jgi:hypothetical protein